MKIYVTTMYRYGNRESRSYVVHAGTDKHDAWQAGVDEKNFSYGEYDFEVVSFDFGEIEYPLGGK